MSKTKKYKDISIDEIRTQTKMMLEDKYFRLWMNRYGFPELDRQQKRQIMKKFWDTGTISCGKIKHLEGPESLFFLPYQSQEWNLYMEPAIIRFTKIRNAPYVPNGPQVVNKTAAIGWCNSGRNPMSRSIRTIIDRMVDLELTLNTNVILQNVPFIVGITPDQKLKAEEMIYKLFNHEPVIFTDVSDISLLQAAKTEAPYIADKLRSLYYDYENQIYTLLGIDNTKFDGSNKEFQLTEELDANIAEINLFKNDIDTSVQQFLDDIEEAFGVRITLDSKVLDTDSIYDKNEDKQENTDEDKE